MGVIDAGIDDADHQAFAIEAEVRAEIGGTDERYTGRQAGHVDRGRFHGLDAGQSPDLAEAAHWHQRLDAVIDRVIARDLPRAQRLGLRHHGSLGGLQLATVVIQAALRH